ncbi:DUF5361 domain-containing protein [Streptomyces sp. Je 1-79]|uniref:DUF5361 domain-containing protein n=1 Tax=Streptomyces sp. Je 1-79 TaxID=2943847 RepID=UPI0021A54388|nr:DUF5361 domain-containing protein [Streptomyces sp. Je 1-79]MCT4355835.1 DUF5361 domain-containing protein [Streptomyces sp. Je 1-79]
MDLLDWHRDRLSARRLAVLIKHMPRDSALLSETDGEAAEWSTTDYLLAAVVDHLAVSNWMFSTVNSGEDSEPMDPPKPVPRPGDRANAAMAATETSAAPEPPADAGSEPLSPAELARFFS